MAGEYETPAIVTKMKFLLDESGIQHASERIRTFEKDATKVTTRTKLPLPSPEDFQPVTSKLVEPISNLEDKLDINNAVSAPTKAANEALARFDDEMRVVGDSSNKLNTEVAYSKTVISKLGNEVTAVTTKYDKLDRALGSVTRKTEDSRRKFEFWTLSIMFFGMQMQRTFGGMWKTMNATYKELTGNTTALGQANLRLSASMTFLQVSIMDALEPVLMPLIETVIDLVSWFTELDPTVQAAAGLFVVGGSFVGGLMVAGGSIVTFIEYGLKPLLEKIGLIPEASGNAGTELGKIPAAATKAGTGIGQAFMAALPWILIAALVASAAWTSSAELISINTKKELAKSKGDWDDYKIYSLMSSIEATHLIEKTFYNMSRTIGDVVTGIAATIWSAFFNSISQIPLLFTGVIKSIINSLAIIPGVGQIAVDALNKAFLPGLNEIETASTKFFTNISNEQQKGFAKMTQAGNENIDNSLEVIRQKTMQQMIEMGIPVTKIAEEYAKSGQSMNDTSSKIALDMAGITTQAQAMTDQVTASTTDMTNATATNWNYTNADLTNTWINTTSNLTNQTDAFKNTTETKMTELQVTTGTQFKSIETNYTGVMTNLTTVTTNTTTQIMASFANATASVNSYVSALRSIPASPVGMLASVSNAIGGAINSISNVITGKKTAEGGIVTGPDFRLVGEAGPEAIIPLDRLNSIMQGSFAKEQSSGFSMGDINIDVTTGPISSDVDVDRLASQVSDVIMRDIKNYTKYAPQW